MWETLPEFGTGILYAVLVCAAYTFAVAVAAGRGNPKLLSAARWGAYGTSALVGLGVLLLAYAFITHDFRIRYIARYSDRSMSEGYLLSALWGGQDGSLLWWTFLLSIYTSVAVAWMRGKYRALQPYVIATLMVVIGFFGILMLFAANPFETSVAGGTLDGEGLNPMLQNFYMIIHPPSLYIGFVGCAVPFAFAMAALITGRLDNEWINAARKWMLFAWLFLSIGNALGMLWAYEELGWGGYWAWDPVENAACLPWFTASAYLHSTMIQERRVMFRVWNVLLICITFFLTIFGTFLTRSGLIASVHSFAQSDIGVFFVWAMAAIVVVCAVLIIWRFPKLTSEAHIESLASREAAFVLNNWALVGMMAFIAIATLYPKISEWLWQETVSVGPPFFNRWLAPLGIGVYALMGIAPLLGWRKTSRGALIKASMVPVAVGLLAGVLHLLLGKRLGYPAIVDNDLFYVDAWYGSALRYFGMVVPLLIVALSAFNVAVIVQEFQRGVSARRRNTDEGIFRALRELVRKNSRRYGGYIVHFGMVFMFMGFVGGSWSVDEEVTLSPGQTHRLQDFEISYTGPRMEVDPTKRMVFADLQVFKVKPSGERELLGETSPAKFIYRKGGTSTTEVSIMPGAAADFYAILGTADPVSKRATFHFYINPLVTWIWFGVVILIVGAMISLWPEVSFSESTAMSYVRILAGAATGLMFALVFAAAPGTAHAKTISVRAPPSATLPQKMPSLSHIPWGELGAAGVGLGLGAASAAILASRSKRRTKPSREA
ncbi:MAG: heme lyase CcmF/NrfE family subunit [Polyangiaceae bacterium]|nr:heme lyase CcmF/NrfE family subunit [Polyangiaceae bacterium]MCW5790110.1 heme lyase CcmF/NrfE family subunit [Polyangiaceae bacterium]